MLCKFSLKLCTSMPSIITEVCIMCGITHNNVFKHAACTCTSTYDVRVEWLDNVLQLFHFDLYYELCSLSECNLYLTLLGLETIFNLNEREKSRF